jgi:hypothetical protein
LSSPRDRRAPACKFAYSPKRLGSTTLRFNPEFNRERFIDRDAKFVEQGRYL